MIDLITGFLDCFFQAVYEFIIWDWKISTITFILVGALLNNPPSKTEVAR